MARAFADRRVLGLLLGRKDLIQAALLNNNPNEDAIGRPSKVGKEEMMGPAGGGRGLRATRSRRRPAPMARFGGEHRQGPAAHFRGLGRGLRARPRQAPDSISSRAMGPEPAAHQIRQLRDGEPSIEVDAGEDGLSLASYNLYPGEERIVGFRLRGILREAASARQFPDTTRTWPARQSETASRTHGIAPGQPRGGVACSGMAHPALGGISFRAQAVPAVQGDVRLIVPNRE